MVELSPACLQSLHISFVLTTMCTCLNVLGIWPLKLAFMQAPEVVFPTTCILWATVLSGKVLATIYLVT